jgi:hypothetical protein
MHFASRVRTWCVARLYSVRYSEIALSQKPLAKGHVYIYSFLLRMTVTMTYQYTDISSWDNVYRRVLSSGIYQPVFRRKRSPPSSGSKNKPSNKPAWKQAASRVLVSFRTYSSTLKMEATCSSETSVDFQRSTPNYIRENITLHNHRFENLKY